MYLVPQGLLNSLDEELLLGCSEDFVNRLVSGGPMKLV